MIHIVKGCSLTDARAASMFEDRKTLFVDLLGWDVPVVGGRYEIDSYDGDKAVYLIATDDGCIHQGSMRLLSTEGAHLLADRFASLCECDAPRGSRFARLRDFACRNDWAPPDACVSATGSSRRWSIMRSAAESPC